MQTHNLGYPRIGSRRELKKASEQYWAGKIPADQLIQTGKNIRLHNWQLQKAAGIDLIPCNDFSYYDQVLDTSLMVGAIPHRYHSLMEQRQLKDIDLLFAMARGYQKDGHDITAMEMTKWFDTNYHYIVPEFTANQQFSLYSNKVLHEFLEAREAGINAKPLYLINKATEAIGADRILIAPSCSLLHSPCDLGLEKELSTEISSWLSFAKQKIEEVVTLKRLAANEVSAETDRAWRDNVHTTNSRRTSTLIHKPPVKQRVAAITEADAQRQSEFATRKLRQREALKLPLFPTTTIGSFPQTTEVRNIRARWKKGELTTNEYESLIEKETGEAIRWQESTGIDVLVHGEFERNDMVEYFGEQLEGFVFTSNGWVQSYGSRCVKPPIIYGDVSRPKAMTVRWSAYAQSLTGKWVKGMLTGPVTILQWSFVRNDQPRSETCTQIALAIRDEVVDLEKAGIRIIQIDEPAIREGLPLRRENWKEYLDWAVKAFRISASGVEDSTQIHTHMCYSEFNDIIQSIADLDADVITIECSRSQMDLLDAFADFRYPNEIGPGVYDIHSPRVPSRREMVTLMEKARAVIPAEQLWVNPDCGLKTRAWPETRAALTEMVEAAKELRAEELVGQ
jgi:5-methyltetrahydropteroyltriglutamate--homocysteine methyltransferase